MSDALEMTGCQVEGCEGVSVTTRDVRHWQDGVTLLARVALCRSHERILDGDLRGLSLQQSLGHLPRIVAEPSSPRGQTQ